MRVLTKNEIGFVSGGNPTPDQSWYDYLLEQFPFGEWVGGSFYPNGVPSTTNNIPIY